MRLVQLTTYPLKSPRHGGQLRCAAIREHYRRSGIDVETIAVMHEGQYRASEREKHDIALPGSSGCWDLELERFVDLQTGRCLADSPRPFALFADFLDNFRPDVIQLEQPWLYPAVKRYLVDRGDNRGVRPRLVYSSQNIEWKLKRDERRFSASDSKVHAINVAKVEALEREVASQSDMIIACTDDELHELREMAGDDAEAPRRLYVTAPNAIAPFKPDPERLRALKRRHGLERYPIFVGSAHPPNADGFWNMLAPSLSFLRPDEKIVVAGGVGHLLRNHPIYQAWSGINEPRLLVLGEIESSDLIALLYGAAAILLPITTGGGSNLKTAEAIYTGNPVVATTHALRGYGDASRWPTVAIADTPDMFRRTLRGMLDDNPAPPADAYADIRGAVAWENALASLPGTLKLLLESAARQTTSADAIPSLQDAPSPHFEERFREIRRAVQRMGVIDYERVLESQYSRFLRPGDTVVDIGAHSGRHLSKFIERVGRNGRVLGFEPLPALFAQLRHEFSRPNVLLRNVALSDTEGTVEFIHAQGAPEESGFRQRIYNNPGSVTPTRISVVAEKLDRYIDQLGGLRFIKIDVEGAEMNVLRGAVNTLKRYRPVVSVEYGRPAYSVYGHETFTLFDFAETHGFVMYDIFANRLQREDWAMACDSVYWDYFMVPKENESAFAAEVPPVDLRSLEELISTAREDGTSKRATKTK